MNRTECANCLVHGWKQPEDETPLLKCQNCQVIQYCSKECQLEHWLKVHKHHCEHFKDPSKNEPWQHREQDCAICVQVAVVGESKLTQVENPNYACIFKEQFPEHIVHPHPFPVTGQPGDIIEKGIIVLWQLVRKLQLIHPDVAFSCHDEFSKVENNLGWQRINIWRYRKICPQSRAQFYYRVSSLELSDIDNKMEIVEDPFELWETIMCIEVIVHNVKQMNRLKFLKDPLANLPDDIKNLVSEGMENITKYLTIATKVFEDLSTQVIPYKDVLKVIGGGSLEQECSFCSKEVDISSEKSGVFVSLVLLGKYSCGSEDCEDKEAAADEDDERFYATLYVMLVERWANMCDFCFEMTPVKPKGSDMHDIHSQECLYADDDIHVKVCQKDKEGRKKKPRGSARRKVAREELEMVEKEGKSDIFCEVLDKFKLKNARKEKKN